MAADNIKITIDGERLMVTASVDRKGVDRLLGRLEMAKVIMDEPTEEAVHPAKESSHD